MNSYKIIVKTCLVFLVAQAIGCSKKSDDTTTTSSSIIPETLAIVQASLPSALESSAASFSDLSVLVDSNLTELKTRMFSPGPTDFQYRLMKVDDQLDALADAIAACQNTTTTTYTPPAVVSGIFTMEFSCVQTLDAASLGISDSKVYFGKSGGFWYVGNFQTNAAYSSSDTDPASMATLAKIDENGNTVDVYQISAENISGTDYATVTHITADKTTGVFEVHTASSADHTQVGSTGANYTGLGCGVSMRTNGTLVYASGKFNQITSCPSTATVCAAAADLSDTTGCTGVVDTFSGTSIARAGVNGTLGKSLVVDRSGLPAF